MYENTDIVHPSRQQPQAQKVGSWPLSPQRSRVCLQQSAVFVNEYPQQLPYARGQGSLDTKLPPSQGPYQPSSSIDGAYGIQQRTYQQPYPTIPPYVSSQNFHRVAQATDNDKHLHAQSNLGQMPCSSSSTTSRAFSHHPSFKEDISYSGEIPPVGVDQAVDLTKSFFDATDGNEFGMANPLWDPSFDVIWADWQVTDPDTGAGEVQQFDHEPLPGSQLGKYQAYPDNRFGTGLQSYSGRPPQSCSGETRMQCSDEQLTRYVADRRLVHSYSWPSFSP